MKSAMQERKRIHLIIFVFARNWLHETDEKLMRLFTQHFIDTIHEISAAVITHCEFIAEEAREK